MNDQIEQLQAAIKNLNVSTNWQRIIIETRGAEIDRLRVALAATEQARHTVEDEYAELQRERDARVAVEEVHEWLNWLADNEPTYTPIVWLEDHGIGILAWRNRTAPLPDDSVQIGRGTRKCPTCGKMGCAFGCTDGKGVEEGGGK